MSGRGQVSVVLILIIAVALIIYSVSLNWGRIAQHKTMTTIAANTAAAGMASMLTSYGEKLLQEQLGGRIEYCKRTNFFVLLITFIVAVVLTIVTYGLAGEITLGVVLSAAGSVLAGAALVIHVTVVEPALTKLWNRMMSEMPFDGQIIEGAIMAGAMHVVTDSIRISDHFDMDVDGLWVDEFDVGNVAMRKDKISRFSFYYTKRLQGFVPNTFPAIQTFRAGLSEFLYDNPTGSATPDNFGIFDPQCTAGSDLPSPYCNVCCQPQFEPDGVTPLRPEGCTGAQVALCTDGDYPMTTYMWQYEPSREVFTNAFRSFREQLGIDDENPGFNRNATNPNSPPPQAPAVVPNIDFWIGDATGYYTAAMQASLGIVGGTPDNRTGVFPFFWRMSTLLPAVPPPPITPPPVIPPIARSDNVTTMANLLTPPGMCASVAGFDTGTNRPRTDGFYWRPGSDEYCSTTYPYNNCINRVGNCVDGSFSGTLPSCGCEASGQPDIWHDDMQDNLVWGLKEFSVWAQDLLRTETSLLNREFAAWYPKAAFWIAPQCPAAAQCDNSPQADPVTCRYCNNELNDGWLIVWRDMLGSWVDLIDDWLYRDTYEDDASFCLPTAATAATSLLWIERSSMPSQQTATPIPQDRNGVNMPPIWGDLNDTVACLNFNLNNVTKLTNCQTTCRNNPTNYNANANACLNLPRSVINIHGGNAAYLTAQQLQDCLSSTCSDSLGVTLPVCVGLPGVATAPDCVAFAPGNPFYDDVLAQRNNQFDLSDACEPSSPTVTTAFQDNIVVALVAANAQQPSLVARHAELSYLRDQAVTNRATFLSGYNNFVNFLRPCSPGLALGTGCNNCSNGGPAAQLICAAREFDPNANNTPGALSNFVIYGWQGKPPFAGRGPTGTDTNVGYWHIIRVEAFAMTRCYRQCGTLKLPWVKTWTSGGFFNRKRCYGLKETDGTTIARVTRYDEDRDSPGVRFENGQLIWKHRFTNPGVFSVTTPGNALRTDCMHPGAYDVGISPQTKVELDSAFMINKPGDVNSSCWNTVNALLDRGVQTSSCARYYYDREVRHMSLKFTPCNPVRVAAATTCASLVMGCP